MDLLKRLITSLVLVPLLGTVIAYAPASVFTGVVLLVILLAAWEWFNMQGRSFPERLTAFPLAAAVPIGLQMYGPVFWGPYLAALLAVMGLLTLVMKHPPAERLAAVQETAFAVLFISTPLGFFVLLRALPRGKSLIFFLLITLWISDTAAYFIGSRLGRRPMAPVLSPKKTWEGLAAALFAGLAGGALLGPWLIGLEAAPSALTGFLLAILGQVGDLFESMWKRALNRKDSGELIPGHGGVLDRVDSFLLAAPAAYYAFTIMGTGI